MINSERTFFSNTTVSWPLSGFAYGYAYDPIGNRTAASENGH